MQELLKSSFILSASEMFLKFSKLIAFVVIANVYSVEYLGIFNYVLSFVVIFYIVGELGINTYVTTEQSKLKTFPDPNILSIGIFKIFTVFVMLIFAFIIYIFFEKDYELILLFSSLLLFGDAILTLVYSFYRADNRFEYEFYLKIIQAFIYIFISLGMYKYSDFGFVNFIFYLSILNILLALFSLYKLTKFKFYINSSIQYIKKNFSKHFTHILPIFLTTVFTTLYFRIDMLMLESMVGINSVGYYSVAFKLIEGAMVLPLMLGIVFLPKLSNKRKNVKQDILLHFVLGFIIFVVFYFSIDFIIDVLFANTYIVSVGIAKILSYSIVIMSVNTYMFSYFIANKNSYINVKITFIMVISNLILNYIYIPLYGIEAAAFTTVATEVIGMFMLIFYMRRYYACS